MQGFVFGDAGLDFMTLLNSLSTATVNRNLSLVWEDGARKISLGPFKDLERYCYVFPGQP